MLPPSKPLFMLHSAWGAILPLGLLCYQLCLVVERSTGPHLLRRERVGEVLWVTLLEAGGLRCPFGPSSYWVWNLGNIGEVRKLLKHSHLAPFPRPLLGLRQLEC